MGILGWGEEYREVLKAVASHLLTVMTSCLLLVGT